MVRARQVTSGWEQQSLGERCSSVAVAAAWRFLRANLSRFDLARIVLGVAVLTAAGGKALQVAAEALPETSLLTSRWFLVVWCQCELAFALYLWFGTNPVWTRFGAIVWFGGLGLVSLSLTECNCFGNLAHPDPRLMALFDACAVASLLACKPTPPCWAGFSLTGSRLAKAAIVSLWLVAAVPMGIAMATFEPTILAAGGSLSDNDRVVVLRPDKWVGAKFPLLAHVDLAQQISENDWLVVLFRRDCPKCKALIDQLRQDADRAHTAPGRSRIALIELPPYHGDVSIAQRNPFAFGRLAGSRKWFCEVPVALLLRDGVVRGLLSDSGAVSSGRNLLTMKNPLR